MTEGPLVLDKLQYLDLSNASVLAETVTELVGACRNLVKIGLENCEVSDKLMKAISRNVCLKTLHLGMAKGVTPEGLKILGTLFPHNIPHYFSDLFPQLSPTRSWQLLSFEMICFSFFRLDF